MKNFTLLFLFLAASFSSYSQIKYKLDSISDNGGEQHKYLYNEQQLNSQDIVFKWDGSALDFMPIFKATFEYDSLGNCVDYKDYTYDKALQRWKGRARLEMSYDSLNSVLYTRQYGWSDSGWELSDRIDHENIYDENNNLIQIIYHDYREAGYRSFSASFKYNSKNELIESSHTDGFRYYFRNDTANNFVEIIKKHKGSNLQKTELYYNENIDIKYVVKSMR
jgi:hypothetical protein